MSKFYLMFSSGEYSDYRVGCLCVCDHEVSDTEWKDHLKQHQEKREKLEWHHRFPSWDAWHDAGGWEKLQRWDARNDPEKSFKKLHGMKLLAVRELWMEGL